ncbi:MAG: DUF2061 domain-containing protein [Magnetospiraceae bacterium]
MRLAAKTISYGIAHVAVATTVAYALTGNFTAALGIGLIEPLVQTVVFTVHEMIWETPRHRNKNGHQIRATSAMG